MVATADRVSLAYAAETAWGETPSPAPTLQDLRFTSEGLGQDTDTERSRQIRDDRQVENIFRTNVNASGALDFELSFGTYDDFLLGAISADSFTSGQDILATAAACTFAASGSTITLDADTFDNTPTVGSWIWVQGAAESANNGFFYVTAATTSVITVNATLVDEAGVSVTIKEGGQAVNGVAHPSFVFERVYNNLSVAADKFVVYNGMMVDTMQLQIQTRSLITGNFNFMGKSETSAAATAGDGSNSAATTTRAMNVIDNVFSVTENATEVGITQLNFNTTNNLRQRPQVGTLGPISLGKGKFELSGSMQMYFTTKDIMDRYLAFTQTAISATVYDADGNAYVFDIPAVHFTNGRRVAGGESTDIIADMQFTAKRSSDRDYTLKIARFAA